MEFNIEERVRRIELLDALEENRALEDQEVFEREFLRDDLKYLLKCKVTRDQNIIRNHIESFYVDLYKEDRASYYGVVADHVHDEEWDLHIRRRRPRGEEVHELEAIMVLLRNVNLNDGRDEWVWKWHGSELRVNYAYFSAVHRDADSLAESDWTCSTTGWSLDGDKCQKYAGKMAAGREQHVGTRSLEDPTGGCAMVYMKM
ncbi:hypothetical protein FRX31_022801 [Thalictrum thalictroides]|uniref:Uncharacterized protein n=1 Tax=Thalictrum thalictroides TaxID=46969 RepID=A0A7J6VRB3_THATH|nr:hypothetical protein FRX31_022801 [Thalictrum thalictroides]